MGTELEIRENPFGLRAEEKERVLTAQLSELTEYHRQRCGSYRRMLEALGYEQGSAARCSGLPFLPVTLFKTLRLSSMEEEENCKVLTSSGTGGQLRSQIVLDGETRTRQQMALASVGGDFLGTARMPMLVIDCPSTVKERSRFSARASGILGFSLFGTHRTFALREDMTLDAEVLLDFLRRFGDRPFFMFGFTYMVWQNFCLELERRGIRADCSNGVLVHGGGWKKLGDRQVSRAEFRERLREVCGLRRTHDYYGMAEQAGSIFMECEYGHLHCSDYSEIFFRRAEDFSLCAPGERGLIQVLSVVPKSYPGHSLLTEDEGRLLGVDDCPCGRYGAYFEVLGRAPRAELRGCGDTWAEQAADLGESA